MNDAPQPRPDKPSSAPVWIGRIMLLAILAGVGTLAYLANPKLVFCAIPFVACYYFIAKGRTVGVFALLATAVAIATAALAGALPSYTVMLSAAGLLMFGIVAPTLLRFDAKATLVGIALTILGSFAATAATVQFLGYSLFCGSCSCG